ncbi:hypothetical protein [Bergeyella zoohelcum]|uniref:Phage protein n=1 Tax=Bergeyella zoohelcum ATCC 43767 TaxID=883096 RepID=K1LIN3_9FLAO|nr:hypothetical protein [Bergeyella zoohelcum]EKB56570.1 hypothetical protein HMPREF9699_01299 [Bergeyella zoohelcum ATCC 43767]SUV48522.1 Uncharacterised protein [Bergeyella zoohelcum]
MARNKIEDLKNHLFAQLERLNDETISEEQMRSEIEKSKAIEGIAKQIIETERVTIDKAALMLKAVNDGFINNNIGCSVSNILGIEQKS